MTVFYTGRGARITHELFQAQQPSGDSVISGAAVVRSFEIKSLHNVRVVRGDSGVPQADGSTVRLAGVGVGTVVVIAAVAGRSVLDAPYLSVVALTALAVTAGLCLHYARARRCFELWCDYHGTVVRIYQTTDTQTFGQVKRGLIRAIEYRSKDL